MIILIIDVLLKPSTSSSLVASFLSSWRYIFIWPNHYYLSYLTQSLSFIASARNNSRCSSSSFFFLSYYSLSRRTWVRLLRDLFNAKKFWRDKNTATKFLRHKVMATKLLRGPQNHWEMKLWQQNCQWYFKVLHLRGGWQHETEIISSQTPLIFTSWHKGLQLATVPSGFSYLFNYDMEKQVISVFTFLLLRTILAVLGFAVRIIFSVVPFLLEIDERCKNLGWALLRQETR